MNNSLTRLEAEVSGALDSLKDPLTGRGLIASGRVQGLIVHPDGRVSFTIEAPRELVENFTKVRDQAETAARKVRGVKRVIAVLTAETGPQKNVQTSVQTNAQKNAQKNAQTGPERPQRPPGAHGASGPSARRAGDHAPSGSGAKDAGRGPAGVKAIIAVASAKGGVGKSTVAVNLACALAARGLKVGLLDADVYGPSLPTMLGMVGVKPEVGPDKKLEPMQAFGLKAMSIGFLVDPDQPMVWRGPVATGALRQLLMDVAWGPLDLLIIDMPPGTGDVQLSLAQSVPLAGAIVVSTPQEVALADVRRGVAMFEKMHVPVLGIIENMAYFETPDGARIPVFGAGGARRTAAALGAPFLGELPLDVALRESGDLGAPLVAAHPQTPMAKRFAEIAALTLARLDEGQKPAPAIIFA